MLHRLTRAVAEVKDGEPGVPQKQAAGDERNFDATAGVGTAMPGCGDHGTHRRPSLLAAAVAQNSHDSAHRLLAWLFDKR